MHDDVIDEAEIRRGRPSTNAQWGNHTSVLAGDWLYMQAFQIAVRERNFRVLDILIGEPAFMTGWGNDGPDLDHPVDDAGEIAHGVVIVVATTPPQEHPLDPQYDLEYCSRRQEAQLLPSVRVNDQMRDVDIRPALAPKG